MGKPQTQVLQHHCRGSSNASCLRLPRRKRDQGQVKGDLRSGLGLGRYPWLSFADAPGVSAIAENGDRAFVLATTAAAGTRRAREQLARRRKVFGPMGPGVSHAFRYP